MELNRETYLNKLAQELKKSVFKQAQIDIDLSKVKISCGYPTTGSKGNRPMSRHLKQRI